MKQSTKDTLTDILSFFIAATLLAAYVGVGQTEFAENNFAVLPVTGGVIGWIGGVLAAAKRRRGQGQKMSIVDGWLFGAIGAASGIFFYLAV